MVGVGGAALLAAASYCVEGTLDVNIRWNVVLQRRLGVSCAP